MRVAPFVLVALVASPGWSKPRPNAKLNVEAAALIQKAEQLAAANDHVGAAAAYKQAYLKDPKANTLLAQAMQLQDAEQEVEALDTFQAYLKHPGADRVLWRKVQLVVADLQSRLGSLRIEMDRPADISVDGKFLGEGMLVATTRAMAGEHVIVAQRPGFPDTTVRTIVVGGEERVVHVKTQAGSPATVAPPATIDEVPAPEPTWEQDRLAPAPSLDEPAALEVSASAEGGPAASALWLTARGETDLRAGEIGPTAGIGVGLGRLVGLEAMALIQRATGVRLAASLRFLPDRRLRPLVRLGAPVFFDDGSTTAGLHASAGALWAPLPRLGVTADIGVEHYFDPPGRVRATTALFSLGVQAEVL